MKFLQGSSWAVRRGEFWKLVSLCSPENGLYLERSGGGQFISMCPSAVDARIMPITMDRNVILNMADSISAVLKESRPCGSCVLEVCFRVRSLLCAVLCCVCF